MLAAAVLEALAQGSIVFRKIRHECTKGGARHQLGAHELPQLRPIAVAIVSPAQNADLRCERAGLGIPHGERKLRDITVLLVDRRS